MNYIEMFLNGMAGVKSESTVKNYRATLSKFAGAIGFTEPVAVLPEDVMAFKKQLLKAGTVGSANTQMKRVKAFLKWCVQSGFIAYSPADEVKLTPEAQPDTKWFTKQQKGVLLRALNRDFLGEAIPEHKKSYREILLVSLMLKAGLRVGEVCGLLHTDVTLSDRKGSLYIRSEKTDYHRTVPLTSDVVKLFHKYYEVHGRKAEYVFFSRQSDRLNERTIQLILDRYKGLRTDVAEIEEITPHMLRHTYAHDLVLGGMQPESIARLLGHMTKDGKPNIQQTIRYTMKSSSEISSEVEDILGIG